MNLNKDVHVNVIYEVSVLTKFQLDGSLKILKSNFKFRPFIYEF